MATTNMEYDKEWLEFCQVIYHMFGGGVINALHGRGHFSQVTSEKSSKGKYKPVEGEFNFPIPSIPTLKKLDIGFPSEIDVGFIEHSLALVQEKASSGGQFILSFDGKLIAPGCKGKSCGDSNMWGMEGPPNLPTAVKILNKTIKAANKINIHMQDASSKEHFCNLKNLLNVSSHRLKHLCGCLTGASMTNKHLEYLVEKVRNELLQRRIPVMCEAYDGQRHKFITEDRKGNRLTKLHGRDNWNRVSNLSKDKCLEEINAVSSVKKSAQETISVLKLDKLSTATIQNIVISKGVQSELSLETTEKKWHIYTVYIHCPDPIFTSKIKLMVLMYYPKMRL